MVLEELLMETLPSIVVGLGNFFGNFFGIYTMARIAMI